MSSKWNVIYFEENGVSEVKEFIETRNEREQAKIMSFLSILEEKGPNLPRPYADLLSDGIHELRIKLTGRQHRILYFFCYKDFIVLTNVFTKNTDQVPKPEILKSMKCRNSFLKKYDAVKVKELLDENI